MVLTHALPDPLPRATSNFERLACEYRSVLVSISPTPGGVISQTFPPDEIFERYGSSRASYVKLVTLDDIHAIIQTSLQKQVPKRLQRVQADTGEFIEELIIL